MTVRAAVRRLYDRPRVQLKGRALRGESCLPVAEPLTVIPDEDSLAAACGMLAGLLMVAPFWSGVLVGCVLR